MSDFTRSVPLSSPKRAALWALIGSLVLSAVLGILALLVGDFGDLTLKVLLTSLTVSGASLTSLACAYQLELGPYRRLARGGIGLSLAAGVLFVIGIWGEVSEDLFFKVTLTLTFFAVGTAHSASLLLARVREGLNWVRCAAVVDIYALAGLLTVLVWIEEFDEWPLRIVGVLSVLSACATCVLPILHRLNAQHGEAGARSLSSTGLPDPGPGFPVLCPRCQHRQEGGPGEIRCEACGQEFEVILRGPTEAMPPVERSAAPIERGR